VDEVKDLESVLTMVGGKVVYAADRIRSSTPRRCDSSGLAAGAHYGGYHRNAAGPMPSLAATGTR